MSVELAIEGGNPAVTDPPLSDIAYDQEEQAALLDVARGPASDSGGPHSSWNERLEGEIRDYTGAGYTICVPNATTGTRMGLRALGVGRSDEVIVPALDWKATAMAILEIGATPVFCDIEGKTLHMDPIAAGKLITPKTRAVVVSHVHGTSADMTPWIDLAQRSGIFLIEDPAQSLGAKWDGHMTGTIGSFGNISFNWKKLIATGDGGVLLTNNAALYEAVRYGANFAHRPAGPLTAGQTASHYSEYIGGNERLNPLVAGIATVQLGRVPAMLRIAQRNAMILSAIEQIPGFFLPQIPDRSSSTHHLLRVLLDPTQLSWDGPLQELRDRIIMALIAEGVPAGYWGLYPLSDQLVFRREAPAFRTIHSDTSPIRPLDPQSMPVTRRVLDSSVILGRAPNALQNLPESTARQYVTAFEKIADRIDAVLNWTGFKALTPHPPVPGQES